MDGQIEDVRSTRMKNTGPGVTAASSSRRCRTVAGLENGTQG